MLESKKKELYISSKSCGGSDNEPLYLITMRNDDMVVKITNFGATITAIYAADRNGVQKNIVAGYGDIADYNDNPHYFGCLLGRNAGRISGSKFELDSDIIFLSRNDGLNHLHGGIEGFNKKIWMIKSFTQDEDEIGVTMEYLSEDGEEGYPGNLWVTVKYTLDRHNRLRIVYDAVTDKSTPVNLSNHSYFNLSGFEQPDILGHQLYINAESYTENDSNSLPTGKILPVASTPMDFSNAKKIGDAISKLPNADGYNHNFVLNNYYPGKLRLAATLREPLSGRVLNVHTDGPGMQVYTANDWSATITGQQGYPYHQHGAIALETQAFPDSPNQPNFQDTILRPGQRLTTETIYEFTTD
jgi:aldose 1-epimerase